MLKLASKFAMDIFPLVIATILGAYIVNHYINAKPPADAWGTAAAMSSADPKKAASKADLKPAGDPPIPATFLSPASGPRALRKSRFSTNRSADKAVIEKPPEKAAEKPAEKADKPSENASIPPTPPAETRRHQPPPREKAAPERSPGSRRRTRGAAPVTAPPAEAAATPDANDLARAAIERLRGTEPVPRVTETARVPEPPKERNRPARRHVAAPASPSVPVANARLSSLCRRRLWCPRRSSRTSRHRAGRRSVSPDTAGPCPDPQPRWICARMRRGSAPGKRPSVADDVMSATK